MRLNLNGTARGLINLYLPSTMISFGQGMIVPATPVLATTFEVSVGLAAQVVTAFVLGRTSAYLPAGFVVDRVGRRPSMLFGSAMIALGALLSSVTPWFWLLLLGQLIAGAGGTFWQLGREVSAADSIGPEYRGRMLSAYYGVTTAGVALGPVLGGLVTDQLGYRAVFILYLLIAVAVLLMSLSIPESMTRVPSVQVALPRFGGLGEIDPLYRTTFIVLVFVTFTALLRMSTLNSMLPLFLGGQLGYSTLEIGGLFGIMGVVNLLMIGPVGVISDKLGRKAATVPAAAIAAVVFAAFPFASDFLQLAVLSGLCGVANGFAIGANSIYTYDIVPASGRGRFQAFRRSVGEIGSLTGPLAGGILAGPFSAGFVFLFFAPVQLAAALLVAFVARESLPRKRLTAN